MYRSGKYININFTNENSILIHINLNDTYSPIPKLILEAGIIHLMMVISDRVLISDSLINWTIKAKDTHLKRPTDELLRAQACLMLYCPSGLVVLCRSGQTTLTTTWKYYDILY